MELSASGSVTAVNAFAPDGLVGRKSGGAWTYYAFDQQGSAAQRLDAAGNVLSASVYDAFGRASTVGSWDDPFGYDARDGYYRDRESEYYLCRNRYYDPIGRWITRDPIGYAGGINLYGYCGEGPVGAADPSGLILLPPDLLDPQPPMWFPTDEPGSMPGAPGPIANGLVLPLCGGVATFAAGALIFLTPHDPDPDAEARARNGHTDGGGDGRVQEQGSARPEDSFYDDPEQDLRTYIQEQFRGAETPEDCRRIRSNVGASIAGQKGRLRKLTGRDDDLAFRSLLEQLGNAYARCIENTRGK